MKTSILSLLLLLSFQIVAQTPERYDRVTIQLSAEQNLFQIARLGIDVTHGDYAPGKYFTSDFSQSEIQLMQAAGINYSIVLEDVQQFYVNQNQAGYSVETRDTDCEGSNSDDAFEPPANFELGSMGGYYTYQEMLGELEEMQMAYPDLISSVMPIGDIETYEGRPILYLRLSDNPNEDEAGEPEILYTALHHAREPGSLSQLIYYLWYMLENYGSDPEVTYLINETEMYFVPCLNPDGYVYNETTNPDGGGLWRKNRFPNSDGSVGVDLNRNYGFGWGWDDLGSSPNPQSQVYRGPSGFSEPETQAIRDLCNDHEFRIALNYHTYGNLFIYPWGYLDTPTSEATAFNRMSDIMTSKNAYFSGTATETVGYQVNGVTDDWMYGEQTTKPAIYSWTPEVGPSVYGFWPPSNEIINICQSALFQNITAAHLPLVYGVVVDQNESVLSEPSGDFLFELRRYGLMDGPLTVSLEGLSATIAETSGPQTFNLAPNEDLAGSFQYELAGGTQSSNELVFLLSLSNGQVTWSDTIVKTYLGTGSLVYQDDGSDINTFSYNDNWGEDTEDFVSPPSSITDSPNGDYLNNDVNVLVTPPITIPDEIFQAELNFWTKFDIENNFDFVQVSALDENQTLLAPLCGLYTNNGVEPFQPIDQPLYDGTQNEWVYESIDLSEYIGQVIYIQFALLSDGGVREEGFYFDDLSVNIYQEVDSVSSVQQPLLTDWIEVYPNPASTELAIKITNKAPQDLVKNPLSFRMYNSLGVVMLEQELDQRISAIPLTGLSNGFYWYQIQYEGTWSSGERIAIQR